VAILRVLQAPPSIGVALPPAVLAVVEGALAVDPAQRWPSAAALADAARTATAVLLAGAGIAIWGVTRDGAHGAEADGSASTPAKPFIPAGFATCRAGVCPTEAMCWGGITDIAGRIIPPRRVDCARAHYVQTFAAFPLPGDVDLFNVDLDALNKRADVRKACSHAFMQERSRDRKKTDGWTIDAWPIPTPAGSSTNYLHCVAGNGETTGSAF
jgi:eukaryotic-like serine/threonine-protein kinase